MNNAQNNKVSSSKKTHTKINIMGLEYVSIDKLKIENPAFREIIEKYQLKTYADLGNLINSGNQDVIKNSALLYEYYKGTKYIGITLRDVSVKGLYQDAELFAYLQIHNIGDYEELEEVLKEGRISFVNEQIKKRLETALKCVKYAIKQEEEEKVDSNENPDITSLKARKRK